MNLDEFESSLGGISAYQMIVIALTGSVVFGTDSMSQSAIFFSAVPDHRYVGLLRNLLLTDLEGPCSHRVSRPGTGAWGCLIPILDNNTDTNNLTKERIALFIPPGDSCNRYAFNLSQCTDERDFSCKINHTEVGVTPCDNGYVYNRTYFRSTTVSEWDLVCERTSLDALANSMYFIGVFIGSFVVGTMQDWFGRKFSILVTAVFYIASGIGCAFASSYGMYIALRVAVAFAGIPCFLAYFTYAAEIAGKKYIVPVCGYTQIVTAIAHTILPGLAYFIQDWRMLCIVLSLMPLFYCVAYFFLPKSPRWLLTQGRNNEAKNVMMRFAKSRGVEFSDQNWESVVHAEQKMTAGSKSEKVFMSHLFKGKMTRVVTIVVIFQWFVVSMVFYGLTLNVGKLVGDPYVNRVLNGVVEILAYGFYMIPVRYLGRRISTALSYGMAGLCCISTMLLTEFSGGNQAMLESGRWAGIAGKFFTTVAFGIIYQYTSELYPTVVRGSGMGLGSMAARVGSIIMPWTLELQYTVPWLTQAIFGFLSLLCGATSLLLPETKGLDFTTTIEQAEEVNKKYMPLARRLFYRSTDWNDRQESKLEMPLMPEISA